MKFMMVVENKVRDFSFDFLPSDLGKERIAEKTTGEKSILIEDNDSSFEQFFQLREGVVFHDQDGASLHSLGREPCISG